MIKIEHIKVYLALVDYKNLKAVSEKTGYEYHSIYRIINSLESELHKQLVFKDKYGAVSFTDEGIRIIPVMRDLLSDYNSLYAAMDNSVFTIGVDTVFPSETEVNLYLNRNQLPDNMQLELVTSQRHSRFYQMLLNHEIDMFFGHYSPMENVQYSEIRKDKLYLGCNPQQFEGRNSVSIDDLENITFILSESIGKVMDPFFHILNEKEIHYSFKYDNNDNILTLKAYESKDICMLVPKEFATENRLIKYVEIEDCILSYGCYYIENSDHVQPVIDLARQVSE